MQTIKTALLSFGMSGRVFHAPFIHAYPGFILAGSWERSKKEIEKHYPDSESYNSLTDLLKDDTIELVIVNTPTYTHYDYSKQALRAGKHVIVEKAFTTTVAEAEELKEIAKRQNRKIAVYQNRRWDSDFKTVQNVLAQQLLGDVVEAEFHFDRYHPQISLKQHKEEANAGAGILKDLGPHLIDQALFLFGMPEAVFADIRTTRPHSLVDDCFDLLLYYANFRVRLKSNFFVREPIPGFVVHGTKGSFLKSRADVQEEMLLKGAKPTDEGYGMEPDAEKGLLHTTIDGTVVKKLVPTLPGNYMDYFEGVYNSIVNDLPEPVTAQDGINSMKILEAAIRSNDEKRVITML